MGIAFVNRTGAPAPFRNLLKWLAGIVPTRDFAARGDEAMPRARTLSLVRGVNSTAGRLEGQRSPLAAGRPLRVLRVVDSHHAPTDAGRMVISGRMSDVCAELERLAGCEESLAAACARRQA